jgi:DNA polymerase-1
MSSTLPPRLVLIDGSSYLYRAFHALPPLTNAAGEPTGAILGVLNMLHKLIKEEQPDYIAVVFDAPGKTFRDELFEEYKANRTPMPDDLRSQLKPLIEIVQALGVPMLRVNGVEADDVIGCLAQRAAEQNIRVLISTGDKDMAQLVNEQITLVNTMTGTVLDRAGVKNKFDVFPEQIIDYLALVGDSSDNIPGVPKVGPKTAAKWLSEYGSIDNLLTHANAISGKVGENLRASLKEIELSRKLATIDCKLQLDQEPTSLVRSAADETRLRELYTRFELRAFLRQLSGDPATSVASTQVADGETAAPPATAIEVAGEYETITTEEALDRWLERLRRAELIVFDTETTAIDYMQAKVVGISFCLEAGKAAYIPVGHDYAGAPQQLGLDRVLEKLRPILESERPAKLGHDLKYDAHVLSNYGIELRGMRYDSMLESYVWNSTATRHDMNTTALRYLDLRTVTYENVTGKGAKQINFSQVPVEQASAYAAQEADITLRLHQSLWSQITTQPSLRQLYEEIEQPLVPVLLRMEHYGVLIDAELLRRHSQELALQMRDIEAQAHAEAGGPFTLESPKQLQEILFNKLKLPVTRKTPSGQPSTAEDVLEELADQYPLPRLILQFRGMSKLKSTYADKLPRQVNAQTGRVHTSYHQAVAATGRLSSADPNLQNIPIRTAEGRRIRQAFIAPPGHRILAADYSQIELRIMAHLSGDEGLLSAFAEDRDIHQATAAEVFNVPLGTVSNDQRRSAKAINFGLIYGMSAFGLARQLGIERGEAQRYVDLYFQRYPGVKRYMDATRAQARELGFVETVFGRRLYLPDIRSRNAPMRQYAERSAINAPMQGTAADIIKRAMIAVDAWLRSSSVSARLVMQVHDELVFEVAEDSVETVTDSVRRHMVQAAALHVPLRVDVGSGNNWDQAH